MPVLYSSVINLTVYVPHSLFYLHRVPKQSKEQFLIKWRDVPYNQSTWESPDDAVNSQIRLAKRPFYSCKALLGGAMSVVCISNTVIIMF